MQNVFTYLSIKYVDLNKLPWRWSLFISMYLLSKIHKRSCITYYKFVSIHKDAVFQIVLLTWYL